MRTERRIPLIIFLSILLCSLAATGAGAQSCLPEGIKFISQAQIQAFPANYPGCVSIIGDVVIAEEMEGDINNLNGLSQVISIQGFLEIQDNDALPDLRGLDALEEIGGKLSIFYNPSLNALDGMEQIRSIGNSVRISSNAKLEQIAALSRLRIINGDLLVQYNDALTNLSGLHNINTISGHLIIGYNSLLTSLEGLNSLTSIGEVLQIEKNVNLRSLQGLSSLLTIGQDLIIDDNAQLKNLDGLEGLIKTGGFLQIVNNEQLESLRSLSSLTAVNGLMQIYNNPMLLSLSGLENIDPETIRDLALIACPNLHQCSVKSVCNYLKSPANKASISGNEDLCNSRAVILNGCSSSIGNGRPRPKEIVLFPNPTFDQVNVKGFEVENIQLKLSDSLGRLIRTETITQNQFDLSGLPGGIYFVELTAEERKEIKSICKME